MSSKYTPEQLQAMALEFIEAVQAGDPRAGLLVQVLAQSQGMDGADVVERILSFAVGDTQS